MKSWTVEQEQFLIDEYPDTDTAVLAKKLGKSYYSISGKASLMGLKKTAAYLALMAERLKESGKVHRFSKGQKSWNKGKKGLTSANKTSFKKGTVPHNWKPIGSERITKDGYIEIKVMDGDTKNNYQLKHRWIWETKNGKIPEGYNVQFKDGNRINCVIDNLYLIDRSAQMVENTQNEIVLAKRFLSLNDDEVEDLRIHYPELLTLNKARYTLINNINKHKNGSSKKSVDG